MIRFVVSVALLTMVYLMALANISLWDIAIGVLLASGVYLMFQSWVFPIGDGVSRSPTPSLLRRIIAAPVYVTMVVVSITRGAILVTRIVLRLQPLERQGLVGVPYGKRSELGVVISGYADTLAPGSVIVDFDDERRISWTHVIDATDPDETREIADELYERYQRHVIP